MYLASDISLEKVAAKLSTHKRKVSQAINENHQHNFYEFVNQFRVEKAKALLVSPEYQDKKLIEIAFDSGFGNVTSFNTAFKKSTGKTPAKRQKLNEPEPFDIKLVKDFVVASHKNLEWVKEMLSEHPNLLYCRYDWGNGDFEEAIEGAGHLGKKEIALYLISQGARVNLFILSMLGKTELVIPVLEAYPELIFAKGAHGFTLLHHAKVGEAKDIQDYLVDKGLKETQIRIK